MSGIEAQPEGITYPPIDELMEKVDSKYALVTFAAKRARQINSYHLQLEDNMMQFVGPVVDSEPDEKALSVALREINAGKLDLVDGDQLAEIAGAEEVGAPEDLGDVTFDAGIDFTLPVDTDPVADVPPAGDEDPTV